MDETKRITTAFQDKAAGAGSIEAIQCDLDSIEKAFTDCNEELAAMEMPDCGYCFQGEAILEMTENLRALFIYVGCAHPHVSEVLDFPLYTDFKSNATESLSHIVLDDIRTDNTFGMEEHVEVNDAGYLRVDSRVKEDLGFSDFFGITDIRPQDGYPVLENVETVGEFASLFRADYDRMKPEGMDINTFLEGYLTYGEYEHTGYHPVRDFLSGLADVTIIIPVIDAILGKDIITGETLNDFERGMKAAGAVIDLFTLGQAMVLAGGVEAGAGIIVKTLAVEMVSNAAGYSAGYAANEMGMPLPVTWILSVATGCTVSATVGGYLFTSADGTITKCTAEEAGDLIKRLDKTDSPTSFTDMMSPEDAARYLRFLENGSTEGLTSAELEGIKKVDELLALKKISYQDVLDIRNSGKALESGSSSLIDIDAIRPKLKTEPDTAFFWSGRTEGIGGAENAANIAKSRGGVTLESTIETQNIVMPEWDFNNPSTMEAWDLASGAYAEQVSGEIRAVIGSELRPGNIWENVELPRLKNNPNVTKITTIDPKTGVENVIFER